MNSIKVVLVVFGFRQGVDGNRVAARVFREIGSGICFTRIDAETPNLQATPGLPFSPRGEAKCVRGARAARREKARNWAFMVFHESRDTRHESRPFYCVLRPSGGEKGRLNSRFP